MDVKHFRNISGKFATGVTIITTTLKGEVHGMTANGFMTVSLDPALILISIGKNQKLHDLLLDSGSFGVSILSEHQEHLSNHFAGRFDENLVVDFSEKGGMPLISDALAYFVADVVSSHEEGDHTLFVGKVRVCEGNDEQDKPIMFFGGQYQFL